MKLAVCAICRNERPYILEWIAFHRAIGFDEVYLYDNVSDDGTSELLVALQEAGIVERMHWPRRPDVVPQREAYAHFLQSRAHAFDWVLICDIDEFLVPREGNVRDFIEAALAANSEVSAIAIPWLIFGSSGEVRQRNGLVMQRFTHCADAPSNSVKTLFRPNRAYNMRTHICDLTVGEYIDNSFQRAKWCNNMPIDIQSPAKGHAVMNHYFTKSKEEWEKRRSLGGANRTYLEVKRNKLFSRYNEQAGEDGTILRFLPATEEQIASIERALEPISQGLAAADFKIDVVTGEWILGHTEGLAKGSRIRVVINDQHEIVTTNERVLASGGCGFIVNLKWLGEHVSKVRISAVGALTGTDFLREQFPSRRRMLENTVRHFPGAEQIVFNIAASLCATREGIEIVRGIGLPPFRKFTEYGDILGAILSLGDDRDAWARFLPEYQEKHGRAGENALKRFIKEGTYVGGLILEAALDLPGSD